MSGTSRASTIFSHKKGKEGFSHSEGEDNTARKQEQTGDVSALEVKLALREDVYVSIMQSS